MIVTRWQSFSRRRDRGGEQHGCPSLAVDGGDEVAHLLMAATSSPIVAVEKERADRHCRAEIDASAARVRAAHGRLQKAVHLQQFTNSARLRWKRSVARDRYVATVPATDHRQITKAWCVDQRPRRCQPRIVRAASGRVAIHLPTPAVGTNKPVSILIVVDGRTIRPR